MTKYHAYGRAKLRLAMAAVVLVVLSNVADRIDDMTALAKTACVCAPTGGEPVSIHACTAHA